jgi:hypothetical protein
MWRTLGCSVGGDDPCDEFESPIYQETLNVVQPVCQEIARASKVLSEEGKDAKEPSKLPNGTVNSLDANGNLRFPGMEIPEDDYF